MTENNRKMLLYLAPIRTYWKLSEQSENNIESQIGIYPSSIAPRISQGHYDLFDADGIPMIPDVSGHGMHHWTTICSYALAQWEMYLKTGDQVYADIFLRIAHFLKKNCRERDGATYFILYDDASMNTGISCAMNQGEAISVLLRASELTGNSEYLNLAERAAIPFSREYADGGVTSFIPNTDMIWYLEAGKFILNGHNYALWGLWELSKVLKSELSHRLFKQGWQSLEKALPLFDAGYWSWYWANEPRYMATIMYHNLHIIQLEHLARVTGSEIIGYYARKFEGYAANPLNRLRSAASVIKSKVSK